MSKLHTYAILAVAATALLAGCDSGSTVDPEESNALTTPVARLEFQGGTAPAAPSGGESTAPAGGGEATAPSEGEGGSASTPTPAPSGPVVGSEALAKAKGCTACHTVATKLVGPAYKDVAAKYAGQANAVDQLTQKVLDGGSGNWGTMPMTPNKGKVTEEEARALVVWVLSLK